MSRPNQEVDKIWSILNFRTRWINKPKTRSEELCIYPIPKKIKIKFNKQKLLHTTSEQIKRERALLTMTTEKKKENTNLESFSQSLLE